MHFGTDLHRAMNKHLRAGITPGQFGMDALRVDELRLRRLPLRTGAATRSGIANLVASIAGRMAPVVERILGSLAGLFSALRVRT